MKTEVRQINPYVDCEKEAEAVEATFNSGAYQRFNQTLVDEYLQLILDIRAGVYDNESLTAGHEVEGNFVDRKNKRFPDNSWTAKGLFGEVKETLRTIDDTFQISGELGDFNFEINTDAKLLTGDFLSHEEKEMRQKITAVDQAAAQHGMTVYLSGLLEVMKEENISLDQIIKDPSKHNRYLGINHGVVSFRGTPIEIDIFRGEKRYTQQFDSIMIESFCTSLQQHIKLKHPNQDFAKYMNSASVLAAPILAIAGNSPLVAGEGPFWKDSRIKIFEQSIDPRTVTERKYGINRNSFPERYYDSIEQFLTETLRHGSILPDMTFGKSESGEDEINFPSLRLQMGTDWRWIRPVWFGKDGEEKYMTLEFRPISSGPTIPDMIANSALYYGALTYFINNGLDKEFREELPFTDVRDNFYRAAKDGLETSFQWRGQQTVNAIEVVREITTMAREGLASLSINQDDIDRYIGIIETRIEQGMSPSDHKINCYSQAIAKGDKEKAIYSVLVDSHQALHGNYPLVR